MSFASLPIGSEIALLVPSSSEQTQIDPISTPRVIKTTGDLLAILAVEPPAFLGMLKTTCRHLGTYLEVPGDEISFDEIAARKTGFRNFLEARHYKENSIRAYVYHVQVLLRFAQKYGWDPDRDISVEWKKLLATAPAHGVLGITKHFSHTTRTPQEITLEKLDAWEAEKIRVGVFHTSTRTTRNRFLRFLQRSGWPNLEFPGTKTKEDYGVTLDAMPPALSSEIQMLLKWKQADFALNRPKRGKIRAVSAEKLRGTICQLVGYVINVCGYQPASMKEVLQQQFLEGFVDWTINDRRVKGRSFKQSLGMILAVVKYHASFKSMEFGWFKNLLDSIPVEDESERRQRKAQKYVEYEVLEAIPFRIREERNVLEKRRESAHRLACLGMEELVMRWLTILPWRQRNVRQCRIGGPNPNLFRGKIPPFSGIDKPNWVLEEESKNPDAEFWQIRFSVKETKTDIAIHLLLPRQLIVPLEEYLIKHRPHLIREHEVDTLMVNSVGRPLTSNMMRRIIGHWTLRYANLRSTPHLFRDAVAFQWLKEHPKDYLTLSKMLWHKSIETTIRIYGSQFNESSGVRAMEEWHDLRGRKL